MINLKYEVRLIGLGDIDIPEFSTKCFDNISDYIVFAQSLASDINPGIPQFVKCNDGVELHWLSSTDLEYTKLLRFFPVYLSQQKIEYLWDMFKAVA
jgi:hypothetical protein